MLINYRVYIAFLHDNQALSPSGDCINPQYLLTDIGSVINVITLYDLPFIFRVTNLASNVRQCGHIFIALGYC